MPDIPVRELKANLSKVLHVVKEDKATYVVRSHGKAIALVSPYPVDTAHEGAAPPQTAWREFWRTASLVSRSWKAKKSSATILSEMRR